MKVALRGVLLSAGYLILVVTMGSLLAWWVHDALDAPYIKVLSRAILAMAAIGLVPLWRYAGLSADMVGLRPLQWRPVAWSYPIGVTLLLPPVLVFMVTGFRVIDPRLEFLGTDFLLFIPVALLSGLWVGVFEETLFRGILFGALRKSMSFASSAAIVGALYALVHFLGERESADLAISWYAGYAQAMAAVAALSNPEGYWDSFVALFLLGVLFCWIRERAGLWWCIGLHASWVFGIRVFKEMTVRDVVNPYQGFVGTYDNFVGHVVSIWLLFIFVVLALHREARGYSRYPPLV